MCLNIEYVFVTKTQSTNEDTSKQDPIIKP